MIHDEESPRYLYALIREEYPPADEHREGRIGYGIAVYAHPTETDSLCIVTAVHDITPDPSALEALIRQCNEGDLSPCQLPDVVDDLFGA